MQCAGMSAIWSARSPLFRMARLLSLARPMWPRNCRAECCQPAPVSVLSSGGLASGTLVALALPALVAAADSQPRIDVNRDALVHMEDAAPLAIGTAGSPNTVAAPSRSSFQTDSVSIRFIMQLSWGLRAAGSVAFTTGVTW